MVGGAAACGTLERRANGYFRARCPGTRHFTEIELKFEILIILFNYFFFPTKVYSVIFFFKPRRSSVRAFAMYSPFTRPRTAPRAGAEWGGDTVGKRPPKPT